MSPIMKFNGTEEDDNDAPLRIAAAPLIQCHMLGGEDAPQEGQKSGLANQTLNMKKQPSLIRKRGYSDVD